MVHVRKWFWLLGIEENEFQRELEMIRVLKWHNIFKFIKKV